MLIADFADPVPFDEGHLMIPVHPRAHVENSSSLYDHAPMLAGFLACQASGNKQQ